MERLLSNPIEVHILLKKFPLSSPSSDLTLLSDRIGDYYLVSQGKTRIPGVNDAEEFELLNVSPQTSRIVQSGYSVNVLF